MSITATTVTTRTNPPININMANDNATHKSTTSTILNPFQLLTKIFDLHLPYLTTALHLQIEFALWICTMLLTGASSLVLYKHSFLYTIGDWIFLSWVGLWLGRHFFLRLVCTVTWVDPGNEWGGTYGGSWRRRQAFKTWLHRHHGRQNRSVYHRLRWLISCFSPYNILSVSVKLLQSCAMAGQYCDASAANGVASAAMMMAGGGGGFGDSDQYLHSSSKSSGKGTQHSGQQLFGPYPQSNDVHTAVILSLARSWGTLCGLSFAIWSLLRGEGGGVRGAVGETVGLVGGVIWSWTKSCLSLVGLSSPSEMRSAFGSESSMGSHDRGSGGGGGSSKKNRRKHQQSNQGHHSSDSHHHHASQGRNASGSSSDPDRSLDFVTGKLTFRLFPTAVRSQSLHVQQMRTSDMYRALERLWEVLPSSQLVIAMAATVFLISGWLFTLGGYVWLIGNGTGTNGADYQTVESNIPNFGGNPNHNMPNHNQPHDAVNQAHYWRNQVPFPAPATFDAEPPSWVSLMFLVISFGTASSLLFYGRVMLPIPEFVAGTNVLKAIRAETRILGGGSGSGGGGGAGGSKSSKWKDKDLPWAESYKSITTENRLRLYYKVAILRILENIIVCAILPQTEIVCRITEHCEPGPLLWGPSGVAGIAGRRFGKGTTFLTTSYDALMGDDFATRLIITSTVLITAVLLVAQMTLMNRTYFAIMGYISGEWELATEKTSDDADGDNNNTSSSSSSGVSPVQRFRPKSWLYNVLGIENGSSSTSRNPPSHHHGGSSRGGHGRGSNNGGNNNSNATLMQWDPKRRYQKGDRIAYDDAVYEAASNSPEGPPFDPFLRAAHDLFCDELGHPSSSNMMPCLSMGCVVLASMLLSAMLIWRNAGWNYHPLLLCFAASLVGGYAITHSTERSLYGMRNIATEIELQCKSK